MVDALIITPEQAEALFQMEQMQLITEEKLSLLIEKAEDAVRASEVNEKTIKVLRERLRMCRCGSARFPGKSARRLKLGHQ